MLSDIGIDSKKQADIDRFDLNCEMSGVDNGRLKRFFTNDALSCPNEIEKKKAKREFITILDMLLATDPIYAALYTKVTKKLENALQAVNLALFDIRQRAKLGRIQG